MKNYIRFFITAFSFLSLFPDARAQVLDHVVGNEPFERVDTPLPSKDSFKTSVPPFSHPEALFPNGFGATKWLRDRGIAILLDNTNEFAGAVTKPTKGFPDYKRGASNAGQYALSLNMDWEKLANIKGFATHIITVGRYGTTANRMFGDWLNHASETYGGGGNVVVHLVMAYGEETLYGGRISLAAGRMSEMSDFANSPLFCNFQNGSICGRPKAVTDNSYVSGYPASVWAGRIRVRPQRSLYFQTAVYAAENGIYGNTEHRTGFKFNGGNIDGIRVPFEAGYEPIIDEKFPGHYKIGAALNTAQTPDNYYNEHYKAYSKVGGKPHQRRDSYSAWLMVDQRVINHYHDKKRGITLISGFIYNDKHTALREWETYFAFIDRGLFYSRPYDTFGIAFTYEKIAHGVEKTDEFDLNNNQSSLLPNHATGVQRRAGVLEVNYAIHVARGIIFQPLFQYYFRPNGQGNLRDAALLGFKSHIEIF